MEKVVREGKVAVIISPGFGAGWESWSEQKGVCFDPILVEWIERGKVGDPPLDHYGEYAIHDGGLRDAEIIWIEKGTVFRITDHDGDESLKIIDIDYLIA